MVWEHALKSRTAPSSWVMLVKKKTRKRSKKLLQKWSPLIWSEKWRILRKKKSENQEFQVFRCYMQMIMEMMLFGRAVRIGDWQLHLTSLQQLTKCFFAHDQLNYARMIRLYIPSRNAGVTRQQLGRQQEWRLNILCAGCESCPWTNKSVHESLKRSSGYHFESKRPHKVFHHHSWTCTPGRRSERDSWDIDGKRYPPSYLDGLTAFSRREEHWKVSQIPSPKRATSSLTLLQRL